MVNIKPKLYRCEYTASEDGRICCCRAELCQVKFMLKSWISRLLPVGENP